VEVRSDAVLGPACRRLNEAFAHHTRTGRPLVTLKQAQTLTGQVATRTGDSQWISGKAARRRVHRWRRETDAVLVGSGTARADDPRLTVRDPEPLEGAPSAEAPFEDAPSVQPQPRRLVLDRAGTLPSSLNLFSDAHAARTTAILGKGAAAPAYAGALREAGGGLLRVRERGGHLDLGALLDHLGTPPEGAGAPVQSLLVEAGPGLATALWRQDLVDRFYLFVAPRLIGVGTPAVRALGVGEMSDALTFADHEWKTVGPDVLFKGFRRVV
jgi:diaminohydroxyphosphoribosylaminopyrimidine deaminase/5-amino-6-(5-phosphoribosylamino)uracil reductase